MLKKNINAVKRFLQPWKIAHDDVLFPFHYKKCNFYSNMIYITESFVNLTLILQIVWVLHEHYFSRMKHFQKYSLTSLHIFFHGLTNIFRQYVTENFNTIFVWTFGQKLEEIHLWTLLFYLTGLMQLNTYHFWTTIFHRSTRLI